MINETKLTNIVAKQFGTTANVIRGDSRTRRASYARDALSYVMHLHECTHEEISRLVNRHRTSVTKGIERVHLRIHSEAQDCIVYCELLQNICTEAGVQIQRKLKGNYEPIEEN